MILAAIEGQLLVLLLMALFGFASWLSNKFSSGEKKPPPSPPIIPKGRPAAESEEERMRRFMEALGLPTDQPPAPRQPVPPRPMPPVVVAPSLPARPKPVPRPAPAPPPVVVRSLDELETTTLSVEQISLPPLITPPVHEFETVTSAVSAIHGKAAPRREPSSLPPAASIHELLRAALSSTQQLRSAFVLREILGPPVGLGR